MLPSKIDTAQSDTQTILNGAQDVVRDASAATTAKANELIAHGNEMLKTAAAMAKDIQANAIQNGKKIAGDANDYVHGNPWKAVGIAAGAAVVLGAILARK